MPDGEAQTDDQVRIVHLSDLHVGHSFLPARWNEILDYLPQIKPHIIIVSGDLVDSPWRSSLKRAQNFIGQLRQRAPAAAVVVIPGNHDTRIFGIFSPRHSDLALLLLAAVGIALRFLFKPHGLAVGCLGLPILAIFAWLWTMIHRRGFHRYFPQAPALQTFNGLPVEILNFDSSTSDAAWWAQGFIPYERFSELDRLLRSRQMSRNVRIAVLHHHALPIPYDDEAEPMMILKDAGRFLAEVGKFSVPLVLHGHKHHYNFARVTIEADQSRTHQVAVLSCGSATSSRETATRGQNFNVITINRWGSAAITPYFSRDDRPFEPAPTFPTHATDAVVRQLFSTNRQIAKCYSREVRVTYAISADGDAQRTVETLGFAADSPIPSPPGEVGARTLTGQIERMESSTRPQLPNFAVDLKPDRNNCKRRLWQGHLTFTRPLTPTDGALDIQTRCYLVNSFAMSRSQFRPMYATHDERTEYLEHILRHVPAEKLTLVVRFPKGFVPIEPTASILPPLHAAGDLPAPLSLADGSLPEPELTAQFKSSFVYDRENNEAVATIAHPPLDFRYRIQWGLADQLTPVPVPIADSLAGNLEQAVGQMLRQAQVDARQSPLNQIWPGLAQTLSETLGLNDQDTANLTLSLMAYDTQSHRLQVVAANFSADDPRWKFTLRYGDGIAGRAYKMNTGRLFVKRRALQQRTPFYYVPLNDDEMLSESGEQVPDEMVASLPVFREGARDRPLGILNISSRYMASKLLDLTEDELQETTGKIVLSFAEACLDILAGNVRLKE